MEPFDYYAGLDEDRRDIGLPRLNRDSAERLAAAFYAKSLDGDFAELPEWRDTTRKELNYLQIDQLPMSKVEWLSRVLQVIDDLRETERNVKLRRKFFADARKEMCYEELLTEEGCAVLEQQAVEAADSESYADIHDELARADRYLQIAIPYLKDNA